MKPTFFGFLVALAAASSILGVGSIARADRVPAPPANCPEGSFGRGSHCGQTCEPRRCSADSDCQNGMVCQVRDLCVRQRQCSHRGGSSKRQVVTGLCGGGGSCSSGSCSQLQVCVPPGRAQKAALPVQPDASSPGPTPPPAQPTGQPAQQDAAQDQGQQNATATSAQEEPAAAPANPPAQSTEQSDSGGCRAAGRIAQWAPMPLVVAFVLLWLRRRALSPSA